MKVAIVGVTGAVGMEMVKVLEKRAFLITRLWQILLKANKKLAFMKGF